MCGNAIELSYSSLTKAVAPSAVTIMTPRTNIHQKQNHRHILLQTSGINLVTYVPCIVYATVEKHEALYCLSQIPAVQI